MQLFAFNIILNNITLQSQTLFQNIITTTLLTTS